MDDPAIDLDGIFETCRVDELITFEVGPGDDPSIVDLVVVPVILDTVAEE